MGILADWQIRNCNKMITPFEEGEKREGKISWGLSSYGYDIRCGYKFKIFTNADCAHIDAKNFDSKAFVERDLSNMSSDHILIPPNSFALAESLEEFDIPRDLLVVGIGKSTYARCGIILNVTPLEPEWKGKLTLEISNTAPIPAKIYAGEGICQLLFFRTDGVSDAVQQSLEQHLTWSSGSTDHRKYMEKLMSKSTCEVSYLDKKGKYQDQKGMTLPAVDGVAEQLRTDKAAAASKHNWQPDPRGMICTNCTTVLSRGLRPMEELHLGLTECPPMSQMPVFPSEPQQPTAPVVDVNKPPIPCPENYKDGRTIWSAPNEDLFRWNSRTNTWILVSSNRV